MRPAEQSEQDQVSPLAWLTLVLRNRVTIIWWMVAGAVVLVLPVLFRERLYAASASFLPRSGESRTTSLANLAGQFGLALPAGQAAESPDFYAALLKSREQLRMIARDSFTVDEEGGRRAAFYDLFEMPQRGPAQREEEGILYLREIIQTGVTRPTGVVDFSVVTKWPSVSLAIAQALVRHVEDFNRRTRQSQASAERKFLEGRLEVSRNELAAAEERLRDFHTQNRSISGSSELTLERDRLQRAVSLQQQVFTTLTQAFEDARIREVRDTPVITIIDPPTRPTMALPRGRLRRGILGLFLGAIGGMFWLVAAEIVRERRRANDPVARAFSEAMADLVAAGLAPIRWVRGKLRS